ncbi:Kv channel-interacting protein 1 [Diaphorina citri]|uniref:Kv channel-interacting protein 1 n=1 Tax=Diaphorina citri TaxID=121845 RepID=A0A3Q0JAZ8_DIACI|nr:Kv channel-interacting protein 1 [Diaphorina citri]
MPVTRVRYVKKISLRVDSAAGCVLHACNKNSELEELGETPARYRPDSLQALSKATKFSIHYDAKTFISKNQKLLTQKVKLQNLPLFSLNPSSFAGISDSELEELGETPARYRPDSLQALSKATKFTEAEIKRIYRNFKAECPSGMVREDTFKGIYSQFFPQGANVSQYAHYVFKTMDHTQTGLLSFEDFIQGLSVLSRGSVEEKLRWTFTLYDINGDGRITREEMTNIVTAIYELMGKFAETVLEDGSVTNRVDSVFKKMDKNQDGVVTLDEFLECCLNDEDIKRSIQVFDT